MQCPACIQSVSESTAACPQCGFSLPALDKLLGLPPTLEYPVTDFCKTLSTRQQRHWLKAVLRLEHQFPGVRCALVTCSPPEQVDLRLYTFWLFNRGNLTAAFERGTFNRLILLTVDPTEEQVACMVGYALEPFISQVQLAECLAPLRPFLASGQVAKAGAEFLSRIEALLLAVAKAVPQVYGHNESEFTGLRDMLYTESTDGTAVY